MEIALVYFLQKKTKTKCMRKSRNLVLIKYAANVIGKTAIP